MQELLQLSEIEIEYEDVLCVMRVEKLGFTISEPSETYQFSDSRSPTANLLQESVPGINLLQVDLLLGAKSFLMRSLYNVLKGF